MVLFLALFLLVFSLFPIGQFVPSFTRWLFVVFLVGQVPFTFWHTGPVISTIQWNQLGWFVAVGGVQRWRSSNPTATGGGQMPPRARRPQSRGSAPPARSPARCAVSVPSSLLPIRLPPRCC